jgi:hypothetical protein
MAYNKQKKNPNQSKLFEEDLIDETPIEPIIIQRDVTIDKLTEYYYDLVEAFKNQDPRVKATDYIKALTEIGKINKLYESKEESNIATTISFTLG